MTPTADIPVSSNASDFMAAASQPAAVMLRNDGFKDCLRGKFEAVARVLRDEGITLHAKINGNRIELNLPAFLAPVEDEIKHMIDLGGQMSGENEIAVSIDHAAAEKQADPENRKILTCFWGRASKGKASDGQTVDVAEGDFFWGCGATRESTSTSSEPRELVVTVTPEFQAN